MKSGFFAAAALAGLLIAPVAQAQITCDDVERVGSVAESSFGDILGEEIETDYYEATLVLPGARQCRVNYDWSDTYICIWEFADEAAAARFGAEQMTMLRSCLTDDWTEEALDADASSEWRLIAGSEFTLSYDDADFVVTSRVDATKDITPTVFEVEFSVDYIWF